MGTHARHPALAERDLALAIAAVLDCATIALLELTSSPAARDTVEYEERSGIPAYDHTEGVAGRDVLRICPTCRYRFWGIAGVGTVWVYCSIACERRAYRMRHPEYRARQNAANRARRAQQRARSTAAA